MCAHQRLLSVYGMCAVNEAKRDWAISKWGKTYACIIAEANIAPKDGQTDPDTPSQAVFISPELYVCSDRNLRKQCIPTRGACPPAKVSEMNKRLKFMANDCGEQNE